MRAQWRASALVLLLVPAAPASAQNAPVTVTVDSSAKRHAISPLVYGVHFADKASLLDLNATVNRYGGNSSGRYNWVQNIDNRGADYFFESIPYPSSAQGELGDTFIDQTKQGGAQPFLTMPMVGWVAQTNMARDVLYSFSLDTCGAQTASAPDVLDAGNGCVASGTPVYPCDSTGGAPLVVPPLTCHPFNASTPANEMFQQGWVQHIVTQWGSASTTGLKYWGLDNEPSIWHTAYWDVHPQGAPDSETRDKMIAYPKAIKAVDPTVEVLGPEEWGWDGYFYSGADQQDFAAGNCNGFDCHDRATHGVYVEYLLSKIHEDEMAHPLAPRLLDFLSLHFYPQSGEFSDDTTMDMQLLRNRSTRGLWDPSYVNESYINDTVRLIPRMKDWAAPYPGLKTGITEYSWGAEGHINGATAHADVLGILGRENVDMAIWWTTGPATKGSPIYNAFKMYRNYDGARSTFGDTSVSAGATANPDQVVAFAAQRTATGALTIMVVNKALTGNTPATINLASFAASGSAQVWQLKGPGTGTTAIQHLADMGFTNNTLSAMLPPQSVTLFVVPGATTTGPFLSINDTGVMEGNAGTRTATFTVTLSPMSAQTVTVSYATANGTATTADADYAAKSGTLTFLPGETSKTIGVTVNGDTKFESDEVFFVNLSGAASATISDGQGSGTIMNDDAPPALSIGDAVVAEGDSGTAGASFAVTLSAPSGVTTFVNYATADGTATAANHDYVPGSGTLILTPGVTTAVVTVPVAGDTTVEPTETFFVDLSAPVGAALYDARGQGSIVNDDGRRPLCIPILSVPYTITAQGAYCLVQNLSTPVATGNAITINSDFVVLDMKGFKIGGGAAGPGTLTNGVYARDRKNVTIKNGNLRGFFRAVFLEDDSGSFTASQGHLVLRVRADENTYAGLHVQGRGNVLRANQVVTTGGSTVFGADGDAYGIRTDGGAVRVLDNDVTDTRPMGAGSAFAVSVDTAAGAVVEKNRIASSAPVASYGVRAAGGANVLVIGNRVSGTSFGVFYGGATGKFRDNLTAGVATPYSGGTDAGNNQ